MEDVMHKMALVFGLALSMSVSFMACSKKKTTNVDDAKVPGSVVKVEDGYAFALSLVNATTGELLTDEVEVSFGGVSVVNADNKAVSKVSTSDGIINAYATKNGTLQVTVKGEGYYTESADYALTKRMSVLEVALKEKGQEVVSSKTETITFNASGTALENVVGPLNAEVQVSTGTELKAADGSTLRGAVQVSVTELDVNDEAALKSMPTPVLKDGAEKAPLAMMGLAKVTAKVGDKEAVSANRNMTYTMTLDDVQAGDELVVVSYDEATGTWLPLESAQNPSLTSIAKRADAAGNYRITFTTRSFGWIGVAKNLAKQVCKTPYTILLSNMKNFNVRYGASATGWLRSGFTNGGDSVVFSTYPAGLAADLRFSYNGATVASDNVTLTCGEVLVIGSEIELQTSDVNVKVSAYCEGESDLSAVPAAIVAMKQGAKFITAAATTNTGEATFNLLNGTLYNYVIKLANGDEVTGEFRVSGEGQTVEVEFPVECAEITGASGN
jgi:hypothetical protein